MAEKRFVNFVNVPAELKANASFCLWKLEKKNGRATKVPYNPKNGALARTNEASTFSNFATAMKAYAMGNWDGIGFRVSEGIGAIDIDHCIREDGSLNDVAASILGFFPDAYFEKSPSGKGLRGFFQLSSDFAYDKTVYYINNRSHGLEVYLPGATNRFVTVTGDVYRSGSVSRNDEALAKTLNTFMKRKNRVEANMIEPCSYFTDEQVIKHASESESGEKFRTLYEGNWQELYDSQSDADMAFVSMLAFWCGNVEEQIDRIFRDSGLMRGKWDRRTGDSTYGQITIRNAVVTNRAIYTPVTSGNVYDEAAADEFDNLDGVEYSEDEEAAGDAKGEKDKKSTLIPDLSQIKLSIEAMNPHTNPRYQREEIGTGNLFADYFRPIARFNLDRNIWYVYDGKVWRSDENALAVAELAKLLADRLYAFALRITDEDTRNRYIRRVQKLQMRKHRKSMLEDAKSVHPLEMSVFDSNLYLFNCANGTLDLLTMKFRKHRPEDFITKISNVEYNPNATCPRWNQFIDEVMQGKQNLSRYLQKAIGYSLTGDSSLECLFVMYGPTTRNGKTTAIETIQRVLGGYGRTAKPDMLAARYFSSQSNGASDDVARLAGARFVGISEMEQKVTLNASLTKQLTGNSSITARFLYEGYFEFRLQAKIFIDTNHLPNVNDQTLFESGRIKIIPFNRHFEEHEQDTTLKATLANPKNLSGILNWCIEGYRLFIKEGLSEPDDVKEATAQYKKDSDRISQFIDQCLQRVNGSELKTASVYTRYKEWCLDNGYKYEGAQGFKKRLGLEYNIVKRRPWKQETTGNMNATNLVDHVAWADGEGELGEFGPLDEPVDLVPGED